MTTTTRLRQAMCLMLCGFGADLIYAEPESILTQVETKVRPDPAAVVFLDNNSRVENGSTVYDPDTRTCGEGKYRVFNNLAPAVAALRQADVLYVRAGTYSRLVTPNVKVHGSHVNYWEGALAILVTGTPEQHKVVAAYANEEVIIQAKPGVSQYNLNPNDRTFKESSHFYPNPAISIIGAYVDVSGLKTFGQVVIAGHDITLERCDLGGGGPHMNQGQVVVLNSNRPGGVFNVVIRNNRVHHSTWGESVGNGSMLMCYNASFLAEHNEFYEGYGSDICLKDTGMQAGRVIEIRYNFFGPTSIGPGGGSGVQGHNQDAKVDRILIHHNVFLNKGTGVMFRTPARMGTIVYKNTFVNCGGEAQGGDVSDWQNPKIYVFNNLYFHSESQQNFYNLQTDPWERLESDWNLFYSTTVDTTWRHKYRSRGSTLTNWQMYSGKDPHSVWKNPDFVDATGNRAKDFRRRPTRYIKDVEGSTYGPVCGAYVTGDEIVGVERMPIRSSINIGPKYYFPSPGNQRENHQERDPADVGLNPLVVDRLKRFIMQHPYARNQRTQQARWALWRNGYLVHVEGDFYKTQDVASLRKTWHAMIVGAALQQGRIPSLQQTLNSWVDGLQGRDADASWWHVMTQSTGFDYPYENWPDFAPGKMWTYSDWNLVHLCQALAKVYGKQGFHDDYQDIAAQAYFDAIGMEGWSTRIKKDAGFSAPSDGVRFVLNLEHMGRLGLLALARGSWAGKQLIPRWFVEELESKQTYGMRVNYQGPNDGRIGLSPEEFPECPYGYLTWTNTDQDLYPGASRYWANARGAGGTVVLWNHQNGVVFAGAGIDLGAKPENIPLIIEQNLKAPHPEVVAAELVVVGQWDRFETSLTNVQSYADPYRDVALNVTYTRPDNTTVDFWGFYDGGSTWRIRFMPDRIGTWKYDARFADGSAGKRGSFVCVASDIPGMLAADETNPSWFGFKGGKHVLIRSLHVGDRFFARNWAGSKRRVFLNWAQGQGYNMLSVASHYLNRTVKGRGQGWHTPDLWPLDAAEYQRLETMLDDLAERQVMAYPFAGLFGQSSDFPTDHAEQELYICYVLARLGAYWNIVFNVAGPEPLIKAKAFQNAMTPNDIKRLGRLIRRLDIYGHLVSVHNQGGIDSFRHDDWESFITLQGWKGSNWPSLNQAFIDSHPLGKPLYAQEILWPGNKHHLKLGSGQIIEDNIRKKAFVMTMSGAAINFGDMDGDSSSGFSGSMDLQDCHLQWHATIKRVWDFFDTIPFYEMTSRQDLVDRGYCLAQAPYQYLVYLSQRAPVTVKVSNANYRVVWINAQDIGDRRDGGVIPGSRALKPPEEGDDWLVYLTRVEIGDR
jgi:CubicO group peptidase (beta-lactamase class C family)